MHSYKVVTNQKLTDSTLLITLQVADGQEPLEFLPGQYAAIQFHRKGRPTPARCFSIATSPTNPKVLQFSTRVKGHYTKALSQLQPGDDVKVRGPFGGFIFDEHYDKDVVLLAGGIGITPFMSMIRYTVATRADNRISLIYSNQSQEDVPFSSQLAKLKQLNPYFRYRLIISDGPINKFARGEAINGRLTPEIMDELTANNYSGKTFFICGPPGFMKAMAKLVAERGVADENIVTEAFSQGPNKQSELLRSWPFNMYALSALGFILATFFITIGDLVSTLPSKAAATSSSTAPVTNTTNSRQNQLDSLVNSVPPTTSDNTTQPTSNTQTTPTTQPASNTQTTPIPTSRLS